MAYTNVYTMPCCLIKCLIKCFKMASLQIHKDIAKLEAEMKKLQETAELFEVSVPEYKQLKQCHTDAIFLKSVWDMVVFVQVRTLF